MSISWSDVVNIAPELESIPLAAQAAILATVAREVDVDVWGDFANDGMAYLAAHKASIRDNTASVTAESLGPMSRSYAAAQGNSTYWDEYQRLLRIAVGVPGLVP